MTKEPAIVHELREEERAGKLYRTHEQATAPPSEPILEDPCGEEQEATTHLIRPAPRHRESRTKDTPITSSLAAVACCDRQGTITQVNGSFLRLLGCAASEEVLGLPITSLWKKATSSVLDELLQKGSWSGELTIVRKTKATLQVHCVANTIPSASGSMDALLFVLTDITRYKHTAKALKSSHHAFHAILDGIPGMVVAFNCRTQTFDYCSPFVGTMLGYTADELTALGVDEVRSLIHPEDSRAVDQYFKRLLEGQKEKQTSSLEVRLQTKRQGLRWMALTASCLLDSRHKPWAVVCYLEDISKRKVAWDDLVKSEEKYRVLAETSADGVFAMDALARLTYVNPSFERLLGRQKGELLTTPLRNYLSEESIYFFQQLFIDVRKDNRKIENIELELSSPDGSMTPIEVNMAPLTKAGEFCGAVCTVRDIVLRREIEGELKKNERLKTEFMNIAAHELRSPVTPIKGYLDLILHDPQSPDKIKDWAKISLRNAERLLKLVNDILDVARLDSDTMRFEMEKLDPKDLLTEIVEDMRPAVTAKHLQFTLSIPEPLPSILGDRIRLSQVMKNLIGNALKFTDAGSITIEARKLENKVVIAVADSGIGISKGELKKIFTKFYQAYTGEDRNNEGTGLGLFISKEIVKKHNGTIWAESEVGKGSTFTIALPYVYKMKVDFPAEQATGEVAYG